MQLYVYNTLKRKKERFVPLQNRDVHMYVCGITPYDYTHLGHARCYVVFDVIRRYLIYKGYKVKYVQNITDIDDKIIDKFKKSSAKSIQEVTEEYIKDYFNVMDRLNVKRADLYPKVTEHIPEIIDFIEELLRKGYAYEKSGDVYFSVEKFKGYGKLSHRSVNELKKVSRIEENPFKENPLDFTLWKKSKDKKPYWESPWGKGRPGWHIECSVLSTMFLGESFDIHGGGEDLIFPHHENEIAQSEAKTSKPFARYWIHNGFVTVKEKKMSKSLGNIFTLKQLLQKYHPNVIRLFLLSKHYSQPLNYSEDLLKEYEQNYNKLTNFSLTLLFLESRMLLDKNIDNLDIIKQKEKGFLEAMDNDFNTALALGHIFSLVSIINRQVDKGNVSLKDIIRLKKFFDIVDKVLGVNIFSELPKLSKKYIELIKKREKARKEKMFDEADRIRDYLKTKGVILEDTPYGVRWKKLVSR